MPCLLPQAAATAAAAAAAAAVEAEEIEPEVPTKLRTEVVELTVRAAIRCREGREGGRRGEGEECGGIRTVSRLHQANAPNIAA